MHCAGVGKHGGQRAYGERRGRGGGDIKADLIQCVSILPGGCHIQRFGVQRNGHQQGLHGNCGLIKRGLEFFVHDALVRGMHVDDDESVLVAGKHVNSGKLREGEAERRDFRFGFCG